MLNLQWKYIKPLLAELKWSRVAIAFLITFLLVDTCPHPGLPKGFLEMAVEQIQAQFSDHNPKHIDL
jgi:hypothetical protein